MHRENHALTLRWFRAFNHKDIDGLMDNYGPRARHFSPNLLALHPETGGWVEGETEIADWFEKVFQIPGLYYAPGTIITDPNHVWMEYVRIAEGDPKRRVQEEFDIVDRRIKESRVLPR